MTSTAFGHALSLAVKQASRVQRPAAPLPIARRATSSPRYRSMMEHRNESQRQYGSMSLSRAIVAAEPGAEHKPGRNWLMQDIMVPTELGSGEVLVDMIASGICHTDVAMTSPGRDQTFPIIVGHEGSGYVKAVGPNVAKPVKPGDPVLLSFDSCKTCPQCESKKPSYCDTFAPKNLYGEKDVFKAKDGKSPIVGKYFGHSSFAKLSVVTEATILPVKDIIESEEELKLFSPLGCGIQTGAGAVLNVAKPGPHDRVMVCGLGGVGLSAVMAARITGCSQVIAVDKVQSRIDLAIKAFGATHGLNTNGLTDLPTAMREVAGGRGPTIVIETTGFPLVLESSYLSLASKGTFIQLGGPPDPHYKLSVDMVSHMFRGVKLLGSVEGDSYPAEFIPELIRYYREGKLPVDKMVKYYRAEDFKTALHDMHTGEAIKPVLIW